MLQIGQFLYHVTLKADVVSLYPDAYIQVDPFVITNIHPNNEISLTKHTYIPVPNKVVINSNIIDHTDSNVTVKINI